MESNEKPAYWWLLMRPVLQMLVGIVCFTLVLLPLETYWEGSGSLELLINGLASLVLFLTPLIFSSAGRRVLKGLYPDRWTDWLTHRYYGYPAWQWWGMTYLVLFVGVALSGSFSEWVIGMLPESWGIPITDSVEEEVRQWITGGLANYILLYLVVAVIPGIVEELFFRGYLQRVFKVSTSSSTRAIWYTSIVFSLVHSSTVGFLSRMLMGLGLGYMYERTGRLAPAIGMHILNNAMALTIFIWFD